MSYLLDPCGTGRAGPVDDATIVLVGCGGTGAFLAEALCRLMIGRRGSLHLVDPDRVEARNALRQAYAPADHHVEHRERDGNADLAVHHLVQIAVARVVVRLGVAGVAELVEQELVQRRHALLRLRGLRHLAAQPHRHALDLAEIALDVELRISVLRDHQAGAREIDAPVVAGDELGESLERDAHHSAARREKSRRRKPKANRHAP